MELQGPYNARNVFGLVTYQISLIQLRIKSVSTGVENAGQETGRDGEKRENLVLVSMKLIDLPGPSNAVTVLACLIIQQTSQESVSRCVDNVEQFVGEKIHVGLKNLSTRGKWQGSKKAEQQQGRVIWTMKEHAHTVSKPGQKTNSST